MIASLRFRPAVRSVEWLGGGGSLVGIERECEKHRLINGHRLNLKGNSPEGLGFEIRTLLIPVPVRIPDLIPSATVLRRWPLGVANPLVEHASHFEVSTSHISNQVGWRVLKKSRRPFSNLEVDWRKVEFRIGHYCWQRWKLLQKLKRKQEVLN